MTTTFLICIGFGLGAVGALVAADQNQNGVGLLMLSTSGIMLLLTAAGKIVAKWSPHAFEVLTWVSFGVCNASIMFAPYFALDVRTRHRWLGANVVLKPLPIVLGMRRVPYIGFLISGFFVELVSSMLTTSKYGEEFELSPHIVDLFQVLAYNALSHLAHRWMFAVYDTQCQLAEEREAHEKLLLGVCDATVWLAEDGDTITQSDHLFDSIVGVPTLGTALSHHILQTPVEQARLREAFQRQAADGHCVPAVSLPTTLRNVQLGVVELLIVDRRPKAATTARGAPRRGGFLVGVRLQGAEPQPAPAGPAPPLPPAPAGEGAPAGPTVPVPQGAAAPAAAPGDVDEDSLYSATERVPLPELEEIAVQFEVESPGMAVRRLALRFAPHAEELEPPRFAAWLQERAGGRFLAWAQGKVNTALGGAPANDEDSASTSNYGPVMLEAPFLGGVLLAGEAARLEVADFDDDEPLMATLHVRGLWQVQHRRGVRRPPPATANANQGAAEERVGRVQL